MSKKKKENQVQVPEQTESLEALEMISNSSYMIVIGNPLLNAKFDLTAFQMKLFHFLVLNTNQSLEGFTVTKVKVSEVAEFLKNKTSDYLYDLLEKESRKLLKKEIYWEDEHSWKAAHILAQIEYHKKEGAFSFMFPPMLGTHLLRLKKNFTYIDVRNIVSMDSVYAIRFYSFCKEFERFGRFQFTIDEMRKMFNLQDKYELYGLFKQKVIVKAQQELIKNSDIIFDFDEIKDGRKVVALLFTIKKNKNKPRINDLVMASDEGRTIEEAAYELIEMPVENAINQKIQQWHETLQVHQVSLSLLTDWISKYPIEQIELGINYVLEEIKKGKNIKSVPAYLSTMVATNQLVTAQQQTAKQNQEKLEEKQRKQSLVKQEEQRKQAQETFLQQVYLEKKNAVMDVLKNHPTLFEQIVGVLQQSFFTQMYVDKYIEKYGNVLTLENFLTYFKEDTGFETVVVATVESQMNLGEIITIKQKYAQEAQQLGLKYY